MEALLKRPLPLRTRTRIDMKAEYGNHLIFLNGIVASTQTLDPTTARRLVKFFTSFQAAISSFGFPPSRGKVASLHTWLVNRGRVSECKTDRAYRAIVANRHRNNMRSSQHSGDEREGRCESPGLTHGRHVVLFEHRSPRRVLFARTPKFIGRIGDRPCRVPSISRNRRLGHDPHGRADASGSPQA